MYPQIVKRPVPGVIRFVLILTLAGSALGALAGTSSVVSSGSESIGSSSTSIEKSSNSVSGGKQVAQGEYTVLDVAALEQRPGMLRVHLQAVNGSDDFYLLLPRQTAQRVALAPGQVIAAQQRPYGIAFAATSPRTDHQETFFLVLDDAWYRELESRLVAG